jgi:hypothetical protein
VRTSQAAISRVERVLVSPSVATLASWLDLMGEELTLGADPIDYGHDRTLPLLEALARAEIDFVVIGGVAGGSYGSAFSTGEPDVAYARDRTNRPHTWKSPPDELPLLEELAVAIDEPEAGSRAPGPAHPQAPTERASAPASLRARRPAARFSA